MPAHHDLDRERARQVRALHRIALAPVNARMGQRKQKVARARDMQRLQRLGGLRPDAVQRLQLREKRKEDGGATHAPISLSQASSSIVSMPSSAAAVAFDPAPGPATTRSVFFETDDWILENIHKIRDKPCTVVQGRYDVVCPPRSAWDLKQAWPEARLHIVPDAGHASSEPGTIDALIQATDALSVI